MAAAVKEGVDYANERITGAALKAAGKLFVVRYTSPDTKNNPNKLVEKSEILSFEDAGIEICLVWETTQTRATLGFNAGVADAKAAEKVRVAMDLPTMPLYFVAQDAADVTGPQCVQYFSGVQSVIGIKRTGAYGGYAVIKYLFDRSLITYGWQTYAWSGGKWDARAQLQQYHNGVKVAGQSVDLCRAMKADFGQYTPKGNTNPSAPVVEDDDMSDAQVAQIISEVQKVSTSVAHGTPQYDPDGSGNYTHTLSAVIDGIQDELDTIKGQVGSIGSQNASLAATLADVQTMLSAIPAAVASAVAAQMAKTPPADPTAVLSAVTQVLPMVRLTVPESS